MKQSTWKPDTNQKNLAVLGKLIEECNECGAIAARSIIQGINEFEPETGISNRKSLSDELADIFAMFKLTVIHFDLDMDYIIKRSNEKLNHKKLWINNL